MTSTGAAATPRPRTRWLVLVPPALTAAVVLGVLSWAAGTPPEAGAPDAAVLGFLVWNLAPALVMAVFGTAVAASGGRVRTADVGGLVLLAATAVVYPSILVDESSTAALAFLTLPLFGLVLVVVIVGVCLLLAARARRTSR